MSIGDGTRVKVKFTQSLVGNVNGLNPPFGYKLSKINLYEATITALSTYNHSSYDVNNIKDGNLSNYWYGNAVANWVKIKLKEPKIVTGFRMYLGSNYVKTFTISGSNDNESWTQIGDIFTAASSTTAKWYEFTLDNSEEYLYYKIDILTASSTSSVYIYELELYETKPIGNESKMKVSFDRYEYVPGGRILRAERDVDSIEAVSTFSGNLDLSRGTNNNLDFKDNSLQLKTIVDESSYEVALVNQNQSSSNGATTCSLTMNNCTIGNILILAYAVRGDGNDPILTDGWTKLGGGNNVSDSSAISSDGVDQKLYFAFKKVTSTTETVVLTQSLTSRVYLVCSEYSGVKEVVMRNDLARIGTANYTVIGTKTNINDKMVYGVTATYYGSGRAHTVIPNDIFKIQGASDAERLACWFDDGSGEIEHSFIAYSSTEARDAILECVELKGHEKEYFVNGQSEFSIENLTSLGTITDSIIRWKSNEPENTSIKVFVKVGNGGYVECSNDSEIPSLNIGSDLINDSFQVKVELLTNNVNTTPSLNELMIHLKTTGDENFIVLVLPRGNVNSFQNAIGDVTVSYDGSGTLMGLGGPVAAFEKAFTPTDLDYKEDQNDAEHIELISVTAKPNLMKIFYKHFDSKAEHLEIVGVTASATLMNVDDI